MLRECLSLISSGAIGRTFPQRRWTCSCRRTTRFARTKVDFVSCWRTRSGMRWERRRPCHGRDRIAGGRVVVMDDGTGVPDGECDDVFSPGSSTGEGQTGPGVSNDNVISQTPGGNGTVNESQSGGAGGELADVELAGGSSGLSDLTLDDVGRARRSHCCTEVHAGVIQQATRSEALVKTGHEVCTGWRTSEPLNSRSRQDLPLRPRSAVHDSGASSCGLLVRSDHLQCGMFRPNTRLGLGSAGWRIRTQPHVPSHR